MGGLAGAREGEGERGGREGGGMHVEGKSREKG